MKGKYIGITAFLLVSILLIASCHLGTPDLALRVLNPSYTSIDGGNNIRISFQLKNTGSEYLEDCKVKWFVDDTANGPTDEIEYDEITNWVPTFGTNLGAGQTSSVLTVDTTSGIFIGGVNFYGIYEMGWNYSPDE
jgi:hypothetical protein